MAEIVLTQAGGVIGSQILPNGLTLFGQTLSGTAIGQGLGRIAGRANQVAGIIDGNQLQLLAVDAT